jgi:beta-glucanase (GH16 family)
LALRSRADVLVLRCVALLTLLGLGCSGPSEPAARGARVVELPRSAAASSAARQAATPDRPYSDRSGTARWTRLDHLSDEFEGQGLDRTKWHDTNPEWLGKQPAFFDPSNVRVDGGRLTITTREADPPEHLRSLGYRGYSSGAVQSRRDVLYGYFEVRARASRSAASSAFWFYKKDANAWTEIDVFEVFARSVAHRYDYMMTLHDFGLRGGGHRFWMQVWRSHFDFSEDFHVYGLEWSAAKLLFFVDGELVRTHGNSSWNQALTLNLDSEIMQEHAGLPDRADLPSHFEIDYVRAWQREPGPNDLTP